MRNNGPHPSSHYLAHGSCTHAYRMARDKIFTSQFPVQNNIKKNKKIPSAEHLNRKKSVPL